MSPEMRQVLVDQAMLDQVIERNEKAIKSAESTRKHLNEVLRHSEKVTTEARKKLRAAGLLKD